jgi:cobalt/nickel transport system permease protein
MRIKTLILVILLGTFMITAQPCRAGGKWDGVDVSVVEKYAREAGRPPREPFINTDQGDLLLFVFLIAGVVGGFTGGYFFRELFPPRRKRDLKGV